MTNNFQNKFEFRKGIRVYRKSILIFDLKTSSQNFTTSHQNDHVRIEKLSIIYSFSLLIHIPKVSREENIHLII